MFSRVCFEINRRDAFPEPSLAAVLVMPALTHGLRGQVRFDYGPVLYTAMLEGTRTDVIAFRKYLKYLEPAIGTVSTLTVTHHHDTLAFPAGVNITFAT